MAFVKRFLEGSEKVVYQSPEGFSIELRVYPTSVDLPSWALTGLNVALTTLRLDELDISMSERQIDLVSGLSRSPVFPFLKPALDPKEVLTDIQSIAPIDGREVVEWMQIAAAENAVLSARVTEYNRLGSNLMSGSGDSYIPGVYVDDSSFRSQLGSQITSQGYGVVITPRGTYNVPVRGKQTGIFRDHLTWGSISWVSVVQWIGNLLKWRSLAKTPIKQSVGFYMDSIGNVAPLFVLQQTSRPKIFARAIITLTSSSSQTVVINFRDPNDYTRVIANVKANVGAGTYDIKIRFIAFPFVPPMVAEIQPQDKVQTKLESYEVR